MISICFIITGLSVGGAEIMLLKLLENIDRNRFAVRVISLTSSGEIGLKIGRLGIDVHALELSVTNALLKFASLIRLLKKDPPDIVHTWMYHADLIGGLAARLASIKQIVWCIRNSDLSAQASKPLTRLAVATCAILSYSVPRAIVSCSNVARSLHQELGYSRQKMMVIPNGFDLSRFRPDPSAKIFLQTELGSLHGPFIGLVARYDPQKNHLGFVEAAAVIKASVPTAQFVLIGRGVDSANAVLVNAIRARDMSDSFHLLGQRDDIPRLMPALDVLVSASGYGEAFPNVLGEALAAAVPCVATTVGDSREIIGECGRTVPVGDAPALASAVVEILQMPSLARAALGNMGRERMQRLYEIGLVTRKYEEMYFRLLAKG